MKRFLLTLALFLAPVISGAQDLPADREVVVSIAPSATTLRVVQDGEVVELREIPTEDYPCAGSESLSVGLNSLLEENKRRPVPLSAGPPDVLVLYSQKAQDEAGGRELIEALIRTWMDKMNTDVLPGSGITSRLNLVGVVLASGYDEDDPRRSGIAFTTNTYRKIPKQYGADLVLVVVNEVRENGRLYCGLATQGPASDPWATMDLGCGLRTVSHELGHNFGATHEAGWIGCDGGLVTTMVQRLNTCPNPWGLSVVPYFSNRKVRYNGFPMGGKGYNNAATWERNSPVVANNRSPKPPRR